MNDTISRQAVKEILDKYQLRYHIYPYVWDEINALPPAQPEQLSTNLAEVGTDCISRQQAIDVLEEQIAYCDKALKTFGISMKDEYAVKVEKASLVAYKEQLEAIPAVQPEPSQVAKDIARIVENEQDMRVIGQERIRGRWIIRETSSGDTEARCSHCGFTTLVDEPGNGLHMVSDLNFCPNCGAEMREVTT